MTETAANQQPVMGNEPAPAMGAQPSATPSTLTADELQKELETVRKALKDANKEAEARRKKLDDYEAKEKQEADAKLSEMDKLQKQIAEANSARDAALKTANDRLIKSEILSKSNKFIDPDVVYALVDRSKITVKDDGTIDGVEAALAELEKAKPILLKSTRSNLGASNPGAFGSANNETDVQRLARLRDPGINPFGMGGDNGGGVIIRE